MSRKTLENLNRKCGIAAVAAGLMLGALGSSAMAVLIAPGQTLPTAGAGVFGGGLVFDTGPQPFAGVDVNNNVVFTGLLDSKVYTDPTNPFGAGDLDFVYQFSNDNNLNNDNILHFSATSFLGYLTNADFAAGTGTPTDFPTTVERDSVGDTLDFNFPLSSAVYPGTTSADLVVQTNAKTFQIGIASLQDGGNVSLPAPAPLSVPEPTTIAIAGFGLCALGMRRRATQ